ncbi:hypothetical protein PG985_005505 [Apiospora marii]|uniref:uncharacterized protein n=1 Tax=Apiospora marii TaxID=335849 RepID=UPI003131D6B4
MMRYGRFVPLRRSSAFVFHLTNLTKRLSDATYAEANQKGLNLRCLMAKNIEQTQSYQVADFLMDWENAATEGWVGVSNGEVPFFKHYLGQTFAALGTLENSLLHHSIGHMEGGLIFENPSDPSEEELDTLTVNTQGNFESNGEGIFIADKSKTVQSSMKDLFGTNDWNEVTSALQATNKKLTHFQRWSDVAFAQWMDACATKSGHVRNLNYFIRSWITNKETVEIVNQAVINKFGPSPTIGKWNTGRLSFAQGEEGFDSILGSPNGRGCAWFLISHKGALGERTITQIDVFTGVLAYTVVGTAYNEETVQASKLFLLFHVQDV